jgi:hypothetical protein
MTDNELIAVFFIYLATMVIVILINVIGVIIHNRQIKKMYEKHNEEMERILNIKR